MKNNRKFPFFSAKGTAKEVGFKYGEFFKVELQDRGAGIFDYHCEKNKITEDQTRAKLEMSAEDCRKYCPHVLEEIEGTAAGAGIDFYDAFALRIFYDFRNDPVQEGCTSFAVSGDASADGKLISGQNKDVAPNRDNEIVIFDFAVTGKPQIMNYGYYGKFEGPGFNSEGLARYDNSIFSNKKPKADAISVHIAKRILKECSLISEVEECCKMLQSDNRLGFDANFTFADKTGRVAAFEFVGEEFRVVEGRDGILGHANNLLHSELLQYEAARENKEWSHTFARSERIAELLEGRKGSIDVEYMKECLADHNGHPTSICRHREKDITAASIICVPEDRKMLVSRGNPCENEYVEYVMGQ
ncbi:MAG: C45 family autoproteolytic acyltransferase/hydrolase [Planctomycetota bacterium]|jgi:isopenicillin-N N-acyltransferase-like protein